jgi:hypothetical protein
MGNWGLRISVKGVEVLTGDDIEMAFTSKYALFKGSTSGTGNTTVTSGNTNTVTIAHGLGYIPKVRAFADVVYGGGFAELPVYGRITSLEEYQCWCYTDATNIYLKFYYDDTGAGTRQFNYKYFLYKDKGKL